MIGDVTSVFVGFAVLSGSACALVLSAGMFIAARGGMQRRWRDLRARMEAEAAAYGGPERSRLDTVDGVDARTGPPPHRAPTTQEDPR